MYSACQDIAGALCRSLQHIWEQVMLVKMPAQNQPKYKPKYEAVLIYSTYSSV